LSVSRYESNAFIQKRTLLTVGRSRKTYVVFEKEEIIRQVEEGHLMARQTLTKLGIAVAANSRPDSPQWNIGDL
jgi:hypothetical protein